VDKLAVAPFSLQGAEVALHPLSLAHVEALALAASESRENYRFNPVPNGLDEARTYVTAALAAERDGLRIPFAIVWQSRVVGSTSYSDFQPWRWPEGCQLQRTSSPDAVEIGYTWLAASAQRTACNTEAKLLLLRHAFESWKVHRVTLRTDVRNTRSRRAIERLGAAFEGVRRADKPGRDGTVRDSAFYSIVLAEWPTVHDRLAARLARGQCSV